jgi:hypothetical protein
LFLHPSFHRQNQLRAQVCNLNYHTFTLCKKFNLYYVTV